MREYSATVGATDGNIITTHATMNQLSAPRPVHGPLSMFRISSTVHHQPIAATAKSRATRPTRVRAAAKAGPRPAPPETRSCVATATFSRGPGELGRREAVLALVLDAEGVDPRALGFRDREL